MAKSGTKKTSGTITDKDLYTIRELQERLGLSTVSIWIARWRGLRVLRIDSKKFVLGRDFINYLEARAPRPKPALEPPKPLSAKPTGPRGVRVKNAR